MNISVHAGRVLKEFFSYASHNALAITSNRIRSVVETQTDMLYRKGEISQVKFDLNKDATK